ncbi:MULTISPECIES: sensor histidine kinase [Actinomadura]|uniref:sensor histidine kinase n=1 Tax=Actinomadura TaxID=1988 RepID=UPI0003AD70E2|nr:sensor histidine kinase [Actinomadura madurae]SPT63365.1 Sensor histidine kinase desK [Actinomadura madurae]
MTVATTADIEEQAARRLERYRRVTYRSFMLAAAGFVLPGLIGLEDAYTDGKAGVPVIAAAVAGLALLTWYYARLVRAGLEGTAPARDIVASGAVAGALSLMLYASPLFSAIPAFWLSAVALSPINRRRLGALCAGTGAYVAAVATAAAGHLFPDDDAPWYALFPALFAIYTATCGAVVFVNRYQRRMWDLHQEAHAARDALARLAVTEERLRFSRDLHDLLGHSLSLIAVKSELAIRTARTDPDRAGAEMADVQRAAREALREVRAAVRGYRAVELDAEIAGVRAVLEAAGVRCDIGDLPGGLPPEVRSVLAWVIREGATNVIKHSEARNCAITLTLYGGSVVMEVRNDGVRGAGAEAGSGLTGLTERVAVLGGEITAGRHGRDGFLLRAAVPLPREDAGAGGADVPAGRPA